MLFAANIAIVFLGGFEELVAAVSGFASDLFPNALHFVRREGLEVAGDLKILLEDQGLSRPWVQTIVIRNTRSRTPWRPAPIHSSLFPR